MAKHPQKRRVVRQRAKSQALLQKPSRAASAHARTASASPTKLDAIVTALRSPHGVSMADLMGVTGWQAHSVRGALAGALRRGRGLKIVSNKTDGERIYRIEAKK